MIHPSGLTGIFGAIALVLAFFALGSLPTNWAGVALIVLRLRPDSAWRSSLPGFGAFGIGGIIALLLGGLILTGSSETGFQVSRWLVSSWQRSRGARSLGGLTILVKARRMPCSPGTRIPDRRKGTTKGDLKPRAR